MTKKGTKENLSKERKCVCRECGFHFLTEEQKLAPKPDMFKRGKCCVCNEDDFVCDIKYYNNLKKHDDSKPSHRTINQIGLSVKT